MKSKIYCPSESKASRDAFEKAEIDGIIMSGYCGMCLPRVPKSFLNSSWTIENEPNGMWDLIITLLKSNYLCMFGLSGSLVWFFSSILVLL